MRDLFRGSEAALTDLSKAHGLTDGACATLFVPLAVENPKTLANQIAFSLTSKAENPYLPLFS